MRRSSGLRNSMAARWPLPLPFTRASSISQSVSPFSSGSAISASKNPRHHARDDMADANDEAADDNGHGNVALDEQVVEIELGRQPIENFVAKHNEENGHESEG